MPTAETSLATVDGRYDVVGEAGRGGLGICFVARDRARGGATVALKVLRDLGPAARGLVVAEYRALARLALPAVPAVHDVGAARAVEGAAPDAALRPGALYIARDFVEGTDLFAATRGKPWDAVRPLVVALARALGAVHARGLAHGDLKPGNVLVPSGEPGVRLIDFGPGETVEYLAPERIRGAGADRRADLWSLGVTLYRVLAGELPFTGRTAGEVARAVLESEPAPLGARAAHVPAAVAAAVGRLLEKSPGRRFPSATAFLRALGEGGVEDPSEAAGRRVSLAAAPLAGREAEQAAIADAMDLGAGRPRTVVIEGALGTGKSRLLREAALEARLRGLRVASAAGRAGAPPFALLREAMPEIASSAPGVTGGVLLDMTASAILESAARRPLALVLDDLDRAGSEDRALAALLARRLASTPAPLVLVAATHPGGCLDVPGLRLALGDLSPDAIHAICRTATGAEDAEACRRAGGNPALLEAALGGAARAAPSAADLTPAGRALAAALAAIDRPAPIDVAAEAAGLAPEDALEAFRGLVAHEVAVETEDRLALAPGAFPLERLDATERLRAFRLAIEALAARPAPDLGEIACLIRRAGDPAVAAPALRSAAFERLGEACLAAGAAAEASQHLQAALQDAPPLKRAALHLRIAEAEVARGDTAVVLARLEQARAEGADRSQADLLEGRARLLRGDLDGAQAALASGLETARDPALRAELLGELAGVRFRRGAAAGAAELLVEAARIHKSTSNLRGRALMHIRLGHASEAQGDREASRRHHRRALKLYKAAGDRGGVAAACGSLAFVLRYDGDLARAERLLLRAWRLKKELGVKAGLSAALTALAESRLLRGNLPGSIRAFRAARRTAKACHEEQALLHADTAYVEALVKAGRLDDAMRLTRSIRRREKLRPQAYGRARSQWAYGQVLLGRGDAMGAAKRFRRAEKAFAKLGHPLDLYKIHVLLVETYRRASGLPDPIQLNERSLKLNPAPDDAALAASRARAERLLAAATALASERDARKVLERVCEDAVALLGAERAFVVLRREDGGLDFAATRNFEHERVLRPESKAPHALIEAVLAEGRPVSSPDALRDGRLREMTSVQLLDVRSVLAVPIRDGPGATVGALYCDHRLKPGGFGEDAPRLLEGLAAMAAVAVERARLRERLHAREGEAATLRAALEAAAPAPAAPAGPDTGEDEALPDPIAREAFAAIVGRSRALRTVIAAAARIAATEIPVLVLGESGTGKELLARAIHLASARRGAPFVAESCAALPEPLLESELFGHVKGAFTGADRDRPGLFEQASGGTLFLDEVGDTSLALQAKLLRALQEGEVRPVGAAVARRVNVRVIAATNRDIEAMRREGGFRDDLFFRLGGVVLRVPALRERPEDILLLAERFLADAARRGGRRRLGLEPEAAALLRAHPWPGNVRELEHAIRAASLFAERGRVGPAALRAAGLGGRAAHPFAPAAGGEYPPTHAELRQALDDRERGFVQAALEAAGGNRARAAAAVGLSRYAFLRVLRRLGLD